MARQTRGDEFNSHLHPKQWLAFLSQATEVLFGGAAGPGKSHLMRIAAIVWCAAIPGLQVYLFRRIRADLYKNHLDGPKGFRALLAVWISTGWCVIAGDEIRFWNGSKIYLCHCKTELSLLQYQGAEIHVLMIDELTHFSESMYRFLRGRLRMVGVKVPPEYEGRFPRILCGSNPGSSGHLWVKRTFIEGCEPLKIRQMSKEEGGMRRQFIPARLEDNPSLAEDDPGYEAKLEGLGSKTLVAAMRNGDWDVVEGAFFSEWSNQQHVIAPIALPPHWLRFRSGDWGSYSPFSIGWWAVVGDDFRIGGRPGSLDRELQRASDRLQEGGPARVSESGLVLPRGALVRYREWYGQVGGKLTAEQLGAGIVSREKEKLTYGVLDPAAFAEDGGPSIAERINEVLEKNKRASFIRADNKRVAREVGDVAKGGPMGGWDAMRARLVGTASRRKDGEVDWATGRPMIYWFSTCVDSIRTIPVLQHDKARAEDLDTTAEDHAADDTRYACVSRPWIKSLPKDHAEKRDAYREASDVLERDNVATL